METVSRLCRDCDKAHLSASMFLTELQYLGVTTFWTSSFDSHLKSLSPNVLLDMSACPAMMRAFMKKTFSPTSSAFLLLLVMALGKLDE